MFHDGSPHKPLNVVGVRPFKGLLQECPHRKIIHGGIDKELRAEFPQLGSTDVNSKHEIGYDKISKLQQALGNENCRHANAIHHFPQPRPIYGDEYHRHGNQVSRDERHLCLRISLVNVLPHVERVVSVIREQVGMNVGEMLNKVIDSE